MEPAAPIDMGDNRATLSVTCRRVIASNDSKAVQYPESHAHHVIE